MSDLIKRANEVITTVPIDTLAAYTIRDLAAELARLERERDALREALIEAREDIVHWAGYASDYFKDKHDYVGDLARIDAALEAKP